MTDNITYLIGDEISITFEASRIHYIKSPHAGAQGLTNLQYKS